MVMPMNAYQIVGTAVVCLFALTVALVCIFWPEAVRDYAVRSSPGFNPFLSWMKTPAYVWSLRIIGFLALFGLLSVVAVLIWGVGETS
jgi:hypothetical protein